MARDQLTGSKKQLRLEIPFRKASAPQTFPTSVKRPSLWGKLWILIKNQFAVPSKDQLRWPVQGAIITVIVFIVLIVIDPVYRYFKSAQLLGFVLVPIILQTTTGACVQRGWLSSICVSLLALLGCVLFIVSTLNGTRLHAWYSKVFMTISSIIIPIPVCLAINLFPVVAPAMRIGLSVAENVLLGNLTYKRPENVDTSTFNRWLSVTFTAAVCVLVSGTIMVKGARPTAANSLGTILDAMADVLHPLMIRDVQATDHHLLSAYFLSSDNNATAATTSGAAVDSKNINDTGTDGASMQNRIERTLQSLSSVVDFHSSKIQSQKMVNNMNKCTALLNGQKDLVLAASQEVSCRKPHTFPKRQYMMLLAEVRTLYFHISFLVYSVNFYVSPIKYQPKSDSVFSIETKLRTLKLPSSPALSDSRNFLPHSPDTFPNPQLTQHNFVNTPLPFQPVPYFYESECELPNYAGHSFHNVSEHIVKSLRLLAGCLRQRTKATKEVHKEIDSVCEAINEIDKDRDNHRQKFSDILQFILEADVTGYWNQEAASKLDWRGVIFMQPEEFRAMNFEQKLRFWEAYWLSRDRLSSSEQTLHILRDSLLRLCSLIDSYLSVALEPDAAVIAVIP